MITCEICGKEVSNARELQVHKKWFHNVFPNGQKGQSMVVGACPDCGSTLFYQEGCVNCNSCGWSKC